MIDMNASIEEIMNECDQIAEAKEHIALQNAKRDYHDKMSGNHDYAKYYKHNKPLYRDDELSGKDLVNNRSSISAANEYQGRVNMHDALSDRKRSKDYAKNINKQIDRMNGKQRDKEASQKYTESASIFDPLFDQI